ncbi:hypothetical protein DL765_006548 [Monosporascus sp. GIB2]|nr:hypothetical protein DL765_006548 [Monosporascus sp. GIB2]
MQGQLDALAAYVRSTIGEDQQPPDVSRSTHNFGSNTVGPPSAVPSEPVTTADPPAANSAAKHSSPAFYGPTSPDYSLNAAQIKMLNTRQQPTGSRMQKIPSLNENLSDEEDQSGDLDDDLEHAGAQDATRLVPPRELLQFRNLLPKSEAVRLLNVYQEVIGELHPICNVECLTEQLNRWYNWPSSAQGLRRRSELAAEENSLLILGLALAVALSAESVSRSEVARTLYSGYKDIAQGRLTASVTTNSDVIITLMMGFYEYFNGRLRLAWRDDRRLEEVARITCTLVVLDRQWSAASGLPPNFQAADFDTAQPSAVRSPYLEAMMSFTVMSHKFNEPIYRAARDGTCENDDTLEVIVFQIEQWRRRTLEKQSFTHPVAWETAPATRPPSWTTMLYLRGNAVLAILLRSFFLSNSSGGCNKKIQSALELITDSIGILDILDRTTDTYRKQHPLFQHFLASACALLFLIIAYTEQNRLSSSPDFPSDYAELVRQNFRRALNLSAAYRDSSLDSRKLWRRLVAMRDPLVRLGILPNDERMSESATTTTAAANTCSSAGAGPRVNPPTSGNSGSCNKVDVAPKISAAAQQRPLSNNIQDYSFPDVTRLGWRSTADWTDGFTFTGADSLANGAMPEAFTFDWPLPDMGATFFEVES